MRIQEWLKLLASENGSDLYLSTGAPPCAKFQGQLKPIGSDILQPGEIRDIAMEIMDETQRAEFEQELEMNLAMSIAGFGRFLSIIHISEPTRLNSTSRMPSSA